MAYEKQKQIVRHGDARSAAELGQLLCDGWMISGVDVGAGDSLYHLRRETPGPPKPREWKVQECNHCDSHGNLLVGLGKRASVRIVKEITD